MKNIRRLVLKLASKPSINIKKHLKSYRRILEIINPHTEPIYKMMDRKIQLDGRDIPVRVFIPRENPQPKLLIFFHGGGWSTGNIDSYTNVCATLSNYTGNTIVSVDYRLAPENPFPAGLNDCYQVTREIFLNLDLFNIKYEDIALIGDSAGGNLSAAVSLMARDKGEFLPYKQILIYPATYYDHSEASPYDSIRENGKNYIMTSERIQDYFELYVPNPEDRINPYVAPIISDDLSNQPQTLIITAEFDPLRDEGEAYGEKLSKLGGQVYIYRMKDAIHGYFSNPIYNNMDYMTYDLINKFLHDEIIQGDYDELKQQRYTKEKNKMD